MIIAVLDGPGRSAGPPERQLAEARVGGKGLIPIAVVGFELALTATHIFADFVVDFASGQASITCIGIGTNRLDIWAARKLLIRIRTTLPISLSSCSQLSPTVGAFRAYRSSHAGVPQRADHARLQFVDVHERITVTSPKKICIRRKGK
jgi:hypothetical protein